MSDEWLIHLTGYGAIVGVLATASWADDIGAMIGGLFIVGVAVVLVGHARSRHRRQVEDAAREAVSEVEAADGPAVGRGEDGR